MTRLFRAKGLFLRAKSDKNTSGTFFISNRADARTVFVDLYFIDANRSECSLRLTIKQEQLLNKGLIYTEQKGVE